MKRRGEFRGHPRLASSFPINFAVEPRPLKPLPRTRMLVLRDLIELRAKLATVR